jgi:ferredoxin
VRVVVDDERCRGHGICCATCPEVFDIGAAGMAEVRLGDVPAGLETSVLDAAGGCPEQAISVSPR